MTIINLSRNIISFKIYVLLFCILPSCGSYQYVGMYEDGIYDSSLDKDNNDLNSDQNNSYYEDYFKEKSIKLNQINNSNIDSYDYYTQNNSEEDSYAGWGQNVDSDVVINVFNRPGFDYWGWNNWGWNNWGWNNWRWNNWGYPIYGFYDPYFSNAWFIHNGGYSYFYPNRGPSLALINGYRNQRYTNFGYRNASFSRRSGIGTVNNLRTTNTKTSVRTYKTTQLNNSTLNNVKIRNNKNSVRKTESKRRNNTSRKIDYNRKNNSKRSNNYNYRNKTLNRNSGSMRNSTYSRSNMSRSSGRSRGGGSSNRRQR